MTFEKGNLNRRQLLRVMGASATTASMVDPVSGRAGGRLVDLLTEVREPYDSPDTVEGLFNRHPALMEMLVEAGHLGRPSIDVQELRSSCEYLESDEAARVWGLSHPAGELAAHVTVRRATPEGRLVLTMTPELEETPRAIFKPEIPVASGDIVESVVYRIRGGKADKNRVRVVSLRPDELDESQDWRQTENGPVPTARTTQLTTSATDSPSPEEDTVANFCRMRGDHDDGCSAYTCYAWEGQCAGDSCNVYDCTGKQCCGGCCCCCDEDWCCEVCGDNSCEGGHPCDAVPDPTCFDSCCNPGGGCDDPNCDDCRS